MADMDYREARRIMGTNFIGPDELSTIAKEMNCRVPVRIPSIPYSAALLKKVATDHILILGTSKTRDGRPLTLNAMRAVFGWNPAAHEPCFYNQDWYLKESFARSTALQDRWYLLRKDVSEKSRGVRPDVLQKKLGSGERFPTAVLTCFAFFSWYFLRRGAMLWKHDFIWCRDRDKNGDRIYTGRYLDPKKINKNGFNVHRHLSIRPCYGMVTER